MSAVEHGLRLQPVRASVVLCLAAPASLDRLAAPDGALALRVAAGELLLLGPPGREPAIGDAVRAGLSPVDPDALVEPMTDAWAIWSLSGPAAAAAAFARMSAVPVPDSAGSGFDQGHVCGVAAKVVALPDRLCVLVSSVLAHHVPDRVRQFCADFGPTVDVEWPFALAAAGADAGPGGGR